MSESQDQTDENKREFTRVATELALIFDPADGSASVAGTALDLSLSGVLLLTREGLAEGTQGTLRIRLDEAAEVEIVATARVVRAVEGGVALEIEEYQDPASFAHMRNVVLYNSHETGQVQSELRDHIGLR